MNYMIEKDFEHKGLRCIVTFGYTGHRCGYVGVSNKHPLYGKNYSDYVNIKKEEVEGDINGRYFQLLMAAMDENEDSRIELAFSCHGGITYADGGENSEYPVTSNLWWFGFDCAHCDDGKDLQLAYERFPERRKEIEASMDFDKRFGYYSEKTLRNTQYVESECEKLAEQLAEYARKENLSNARD